MRFLYKINRYIAKIFVKEGDKVKAGSPIAILCEEKEDINKFEQYQPSE
jgi:multidrug efflux pump subunit AcrA (membrane-fusion protein)